MPTSVPRLVKIPVNKLCAGPPSQWSRCALWVLGGFADDLSASRQGLSICQHIPPIRRLPTQAHPHWHVCPCHPETGAVQEPPRVTVGNAAQVLIDPLDPEYDCFTILTMAGLAGGLV